MKVLSAQVRGEVSDFVSLWLNTQEKQPRRQNDLFYSWFQKVRSPSSPRSGSAEAHNMGDRMQRER